VVAAFLLAAGAVAILACLARWGRPVLAGYAALVVLALSLARGLVRRGAEHWEATAANGLAVASVTLLFGLAAAFVGHVVREHELNRREARMSRQELLDWQFELQQRFALGRRHAKPSTPASRAAAAFRQQGQYPSVALSLALAIGTLRVAAVSSLARPLETANLTQVVFVLLAVLFVIAVGYLAPSPRLALVAMPLCVVGVFLPTGLPRPGFGPRVLMGSLAGGDVLLWVAAALLGGLVIGQVLKANQSEMRRRRLQANDTPTLAAELVRTHWRLYGRQRRLVVLVIDVAGSTTMKQGADPGRVEYSFRAYQEMIAEVTQERGGKVVSTAGDGAVCSFTDASSALETAREVQTRLPAFNAGTNRLEVPFRVRIGLHAGETGVDLSHAPFNALIDVAAHVERIAPVGGVAVTQELVALLPNEGFVELAAKVHGHRVSVVLDPERANA
jgi:class 3 adenylate cyclase